MRVIEHPQVKCVAVKCPNCHIIFDDDELIVDFGFFSITYTCPYCNYRQKKYYYWDFPDFPEWEDEETELITEENLRRLAEEDENIDSN